MQSLVFVNPLKPGMLETYKAWTKEITGPKKKEYTDLLKRYGIIEAKVYYHKIAGKEIVIVYHEAEDNALELLADFGKSTHPFDQWFFEELSKMHEFDGSETMAQLLFTYEV